MNKIKEDAAILSEKYSRNFNDFVKAVSSMKEGSFVDNYINAKEKRRKYLLSKNTLVPLEDGAYYEINGLFNNIKLSTYQVNFDDDFEIAELFQNYYDKESLKLLGGEHPDIPIKYIDMKDEFNKSINDSMVVKYDKEKDILVDELSGLKIRLVDKNVADEFNNDILFIENEEEKSKKTPFVILIDEENFDLDCKKVPKEFINKNKENLSIYKYYMEYGMKKRKDALDKVINIEHTIAKMYNIFNYENNTDVTKVLSYFINTRNWL